MSRITLVPASPVPFAAGILSPPGLCWMRAPARCTLAGGVARPLRGLLSPLPAEREETPRHLSARYDGLPQVALGGLATVLPHPSTPPHPPPKAGWAAEGGGKRGNARGWGFTVPGCLAGAPLIPFVWGARLASNGGPHLCSCRGGGGTHPDFCGLAVKPQAPLLVCSSVNSFTLAPQAFARGPTISYATGQGLLGWA